MSDRQKVSEANVPLFGLLLLFVGVFLYVSIKMNSEISLANLSVLTGILLVALSAYSLANPAAVGLVLRAFPRANLPGYVLMLSATAWFLWNIKSDDMADYREYKHWFYIGFGSVGVGSCLFLRDFLAVRGLAVFLLLFAKLLLDTQRHYMLATPVEYMSEWRLVFAVWAYLIIIISMWLVISPWRMRDMIDWIICKSSWFAVKKWFHLAFGILLIALGLTVFGVPDMPLE